VLADPLARRLLLLALVNAAPVAVTSTLFLFFVESRLAAPGWPKGRSCCCSSCPPPPRPGLEPSGRAVGPKPCCWRAWGWRSCRLSPSRLTLGAGDTLAFAVICAASVRRLARTWCCCPRSLRATCRAARGRGAGLRPVVLCIQAGAGLFGGRAFPDPAGGGLCRRGRQPRPALHLLTLLYAALPCALKLLADRLLLATPVPEV
jgi:glycoside/pentoside/hexuronide:cation symporter, GPH family